MPKRLGIRFETALLSVKAGLRAAEIANLARDMVLDPNGTVGTTLELRDCAAKKVHGQIIPLHEEHSQCALLGGFAEGNQPVVRSERGNKMGARSIVYLVWPCVS